MNHKTFSDTDQQLLEDIMRHRRDVRGNNFLHDPLPSADIDRILHAASLAPSVGFSQPWEFVIIQKMDIKKQIFNSFQQENTLAAIKFDPARQRTYSQLKLEGILEAPVNIAVFYAPTNAPVLGQNSMKAMGEYSVVCAVQNMWLMARSLNIGMGWVSILCPETVKKIVNAPATHKLVAYLCLGYVKAFADTPELEQLDWEKRKPLSHTIQFETY
jgi:5,6-dimethylbenzimidazole synthase